MVQDIYKISDELLAAYLEGSTTIEETMQVLNAIRHDKELQEVVKVSATVDQQMSFMEGPSASDRTQKKVATLPMLALAADNEINHHCDILCEAYAMKALGLNIAEKELAEEAEEIGWLKEGGMPLHHIGHLAASQGLSVTRRYKCQMCDLKEALDQGLFPIVVVDGGELTGNLEAEALEDALEGLKPDHAVVVRAYDAEKEEVTIYNPSYPDELQVYPEIQFVWAWEDSQYYMVCIGTGDEDYHPHPIDLGDVELPEELHELQEAIAENAHEVWAMNREKEGWIYGEERDDVLMTNPDMVPYSQLPESEKAYDRGVAMDTLKLVRKLGYEIVKRKE